MYLVVEEIHYQAIDEKHYYVRFSDADMVRCQAWLDTKKSLEEVEGDKKNYAIFSTAS
jgi:hypothetical protein